MADESKGLSIKRKSKKENTNFHKHSIPVLIEKIIENSDILLYILDARFYRPDQKQGH